MVASSLAGSKLSHQSAKFRISLKWMQPIRVKELEQQRIQMNYGMKLGNALLTCGRVPLPVHPPKVRSSSE